SLEDMQNIVRSVKERFEEWNRVMKGMIQGLTLNEGEEGKASSLFLVKEFRIKQLNDRLYRAARNPIAMISFEQDPDPGMMGYREYLHESVRGAAAQLLAQSRWEASIGDHGKPQLSLLITAEKSLNYDPDSVKNIHQSLHDYFKEDIDSALANKDVFDFL